MALRKTDPERMQAVLGTLVRAIRMLAIAILPVVVPSRRARCSTRSVPRRAITRQSTMTAGTAARRHRASSSHRVADLPAVELPAAAA